MSVTCLTPRTNPRRSYASVGEEKPIKLLVAVSCNSRESLSKLVHSRLLANEWRSANSSLDKPRLSRSTTEQVLQFGYDHAVDVSRIETLQNLTHCFCSSTQPLRENETKQLRITQRLCKTYQSLIICLQVHGDLLPVLTIENLILSLSCCLELNQQAIANILLWHLEELLNEPPILDLIKVC